MALRRICGTLIVLIELCVAVILLLLPAIAVVGMAEATETVTDLIYTLAACTVYIHPNFVRTMETITSDIKTVFAEW